MNSTANETTLSDLQPLNTTNFTESEELQRIAEAFFTRSLLAETESEFQAELMNVLMSIAVYCKLRDYDFDELVKTHGAYIQDRLLDPRDWFAANYGALCEMNYTGGEVDPISEREAIAGMFNALAEISFEHGFDIEAVIPNG